MFVRRSVAVACARRAAAAAAPVIGLGVAAALGLATLSGDKAPSAPADDVWLLAHVQHETHGTHAIDGAGTSTSLEVGLIADCRRNDRPPVCGDPPARWLMAARPLEVCSYAGGLPSWLTRERFEQLVAQAAEIWNDVEAAIGVRYRGACAGGERWTLANGRNEIGFDDDRSAVVGSAAAVTTSFTSWSPPVNPTERWIDEADVIIHPQFPASPECFLTTMIHELGHALGFAHSDDAGDVMFPSFIVSRPSTCNQGPSAKEQQRLRELYGVNRRPTLAVTDRAAAPGATVTLETTATDPEGEPLTLEWQQVEGPLVALSVDGAHARFTAPAAARLRFEVSARDRFLHRAKASVTVEVTTSTREGRVSAPAIRSGAVPLSGGFGLVIVGESDTDGLVAAAGCPAPLALWATLPSGDYVMYVSATAVASVNDAWRARFPGRLPAGTVLLGRCGTG